MKVLLVENDGDEAELLSKELRKASEQLPNLEIEIAVSKEEATRVIRQKKYDAIIADLNLLDSRGLDTVHALLNETRTPVIVYTGITDPEIIRKATALGVADFIPKENDLSVRLVTAAITAIERKNTPSSTDQKLMDSAEKLTADKE